MSEEAATTVVEAAISAISLKSLVAPKSNRFRTFLFLTLCKQGEKINLRAFDFRKELFRGDFFGLS